MDVIILGATSLSSGQQKWSGIKTAVRYGDRQCSPPYDSVEVTIAEAYETMNNGKLPFAG
ncbi:MAG: hypothetical protein A4E19_11575 [Nitrospira sp. SG-bin1]|nr:MAG: hypothetical protein A4E19_10080 [Nitrospira sp. SG-bin1]OQW38022.1 MAG: hypothetical protein A4E19_11575 [Nitrospira sp. SG-bin1]